MKADTNFYIDRMFGLPIVVPVINGIVQEFNDQEYHGHLSNKTAGRHISELKEICSTKLHKTWVKNWSIAKMYNETKYNNIEFQIDNLKRELVNFNKTIIVKGDSAGVPISYRTYESNANFETRVIKHELNKTQAKNMLAELEEKFKEAKEKINFAKLQVFNEHQIQF
jgi:hypothetical protein